MAELNVDFRKKKAGGLLTGGFFGVRQGKRAGIEVPALDITVIWRVIASISLLDYIKPDQYLWQRGIHQSTVPRIH